MMPEWGLGFWQCKLRYWNQEQLLEVAREFRRRGIPLDLIVIDFFHWPHMGDFSFEREFWPDPKAMCDELHEMGIKLMVSVWPQVAIESENYAEMKSRNLLVMAEKGEDIGMMFEGLANFLTLPILLRENMSGINVEPIMRIWVSMPSGWMKLSRNTVPTILRTIAIMLVRTNKLVIYFQ